MNKTLNIKEIRDADLAFSNSDRNVHDHLKHLSVPELQAVSLSDRLPWHSVCLNVSGDMNVGTIIRTSHCLGAASVIIAGRRRFDSRGTVGSANYIQVDRHNCMNDDGEIDADEFWNLINSKNWLPILVETGGVSLPKLNWKDLSSDREFCLIMGNETNGIPDNIINHPMRPIESITIGIPQLGVIRSLNCATAHAIVAGAMCMNMGWM